METVKFIRCSPIEGILINVFRNNNKIIKASFNSKFRNKTLRECLSYLKEEKELSEEILIRIIEETNEYHLQNYKSIQENINSYI